MPGNVTPTQYYIKGLTLEQALRGGLVDRIIEELRREGVRPRLVAVVIDPGGEPGLVLIGHRTPREAEAGGLRILLDDPDMGERVRRAVERAVREWGRRR